MAVKQPGEDHQQLRTDAESRLGDPSEADSPLRNRPAEELLHELQVHQIELELQNEALRQAHQIIEESRDRYLDLYDFAPIGYLTLNRAAVIVEANLTSADLFGMPRKELLNRRFTILVSPEYREHWSRQFADKFVNSTSHGDKQGCELALRRADGSLFYARLDCLRMERSGEPPMARIALTDITERRLAQQHLARLVDSAMDAIVSVDEKQRIVLFNPAAERMFGLAAAEALGQPLDTLLPEEARNLHTEHIRGFSHAGLASRWLEDRGTLRGRRANGERFPIEVSLSQVEVQGHKLFTAILRDISERKRAEQALIEADRRKDEFLAMLSHELRNPLAPIRNAAHVLGRLETREPEVRWAQAVIERQVVHLTRLVDDLLDVSRIVRGKVALQQETLLLAAVVNQALEMARPLIEAKGHRLELRLPETPVWLRGDPVRLAQVLLNLLDNAAKYTPAGGRIELNVGVGGETIEIRLRDNGIGIPGELRPHIFELFQQGERALDRAQGGLGIGLTLAKQLVEMHGGLIEVASAGPGLGSEFTIRLPAWVDALPATGQDVPKTPPAKANCRVLVVDDDPAVADSMAALLLIEGHDVRTAANGEAALALARDFHPRLVLLDIGLIGMDGYEVARRLRAQQGSAEKLCLVAVTGYGHAEARARAQEAGFDLHLVKPVFPEAICVLLAEIGGS